MSDLRPKFIYFDLDDTLLDHKKAEQNGLRDIHSHFEQFNDISLEKLIDTYHVINKGLWEEYGKGKIDRHILHRRRFEETFIKLSINTSFYEEAGKMYMQYYRTHWEWIKGAKEAFDRIRAKYDVGLITNGFAETQWMKIRQFKFQDIVSQIVISEEVGVMKPHPKIFDHSTELVGLDRTEILYVGDSVSSDVKGGKKAGWKVAWYKSNPTKEEEKLADLVFDDWNELLKSLGITD